jgi:hypothetical protein
MTIVKGAAALIAVAFIVGAAVPAQAQYLFPSYGSTNTNGWQASSVNSPNRDFLSVGTQPAGNYANTFGFDNSASGADANASCYPAQVRYRTGNGHMVSRTETICP